MKRRDVYTVTVQEVTISEIAVIAASPKEALELVSNGQGSELSCSQTVAAEVEVPDTGALDLNPVPAEEDDE